MFSFFLFLKEKEAKRTSLQNRYAVLPSCVAMIALL